LFNSLRRMAITDVPIKFKLDCSIFKIVILPRLTDRRSAERTDSPTLHIFCDAAFISILSRTFNENLKPIAIVYQKLWSFRLKVIMPTDGQMDLCLVFLKILGEGAPPMTPLFRFLVDYLSPDECINKTK